jgi:glycosyltransferase involved in cell wall biosynthesis
VHRSFLFFRAGARFGLPGSPLLALHLFALLSGAGLLALAARTARARRRAPRLPPPPETPAEPGQVTVLLPVRDEEVNVLPCLETLLAQTVHPRVRVIDDGSTDATAALVQARLGTSPGLTLLAAGPLPAGWRGKVHALAVGVEGVESPWLLSTDADTRHHPELLARARAAAALYRLNAVSLAGQQVARGIAESLLTPAVFALLDFLLGDWRAAAEGEPPIANGQYILIERRALEECGGFAPLRAETLDDVALVQRLHDQGLRSGFFRAPDLFSVRMYRGTREVTQGWRRNLGGFLGARLGVVAATLAVLLLPPLAAAAELASGHPGAALLLWAAGAAASALCRASGGWSPRPEAPQGRAPSGCRHDPFVDFQPGNSPARLFHLRSARSASAPPAGDSNHRSLWGLLYPLDALFLAGVLAMGVADRRRGRLTSWKGRKIEL